MKNKKTRLCSTLLVLMIAFGLLLPMASPVAAAGTPPTTISAPENIGAADYMGGAVACTLSAPDDLRALISQTQAERGYSMKIMVQQDIKIDSGSWHYSSDWDNPSTYAKYAIEYYNILTGGVNGVFLGSNRLTFKTTFPDETNAPVNAPFTSWDWYKKHTLTLRSRFVILFNNNNLVFSDWSKEYVFSDSNKMDYKKIMNENAPTILSSKIETRGVNKVPWAVLQLAQHPDAVQMFNAASGNSMWTEIWLRKSGEKEFKKVGEARFSNEILSIDVSAYFEKNLSSYDAQAYEVKVRYKIDERAYRQSGVTAMTWIYSQFSNVLSYNMPAWSGASTWATSELQKASDMGLIPDLLKGQDMTKNITREEFSEVALLMYQKASGVLDTTPVSPNPFTDTTNPQVLKAFKLGIVKGISDTEFKPKALINREQVSAMLTRAIKLIAPNADYSTTGAPTFADVKYISNWALNDCLFIAKIGIIKGTNNNFMPKATTEAQKAVNYASTSREQALAMSVRTVDKINEIK